MDAKIADDILQETSLIAQLLKGLKIKQKPITPSQLRERAEQIIEGILKANQLSYRKIKESRRSTTGHLLRYSFQFNGESYIAKGFVAFDSGYMSVVVWDEDEQQVQVVLTAGYVMKELSAIRAVGSNRLYKWLKGKSK